MVTGATEKTGNRPNMVTGATEQGVHEEVTYCAPSTFSGKQKKKKFYQSAANPHRKHPCDDRSKPNFVGPSAVGN